MFLRINQTLCRECVGVYSDKNEAPPKHMCKTPCQLLARISSTKNIFLTESEASKPDGHKNVHGPPPRWTVLGTAQQSGGGRGMCCSEWGAKGDRARVWPPLSRRGPGPSAGSVRLRLPASGYHNRNKNKHKLKDSSQAGEDDDNHLSTFFVCLLFMP